jgi:hypothetical protein
MSAFRDSFLDITGFLIGCTTTYMEAIRSNNRMRYTHFFFFFYSEKGLTVGFCSRPSD